MEVHSQSQGACICCRDAGVSSERQAAKIHNENGQLGVSHSQRMPRSTGGGMPDVSHAKPLSHAKPCYSMCLCKSHSKSAWRDAQNRQPAPFEALQVKVHEHGDRAAATNVQNSNRKRKDAKRCKKYQKVVMGKLTRA